jgi:hypothetical protein
VRGRFFSFALAVGAAATVAACGPAYNDYGYGYPSSYGYPSDYAYPDDYAYSTPGYPYYGPAPQGWAYYDPSPRRRFYRGWDGFPDYDRWDRHDDDRDRRRHRDRDHDDDDHDDDDHGNGGGPPVAGPPPPPGPPPVASVRPRGGPSSHTVTQERGRSSGPIYIPLPGQNPRQE